MRRRHKNCRDQGSVEMNLAAMLDMAFQLLTFFILTFRPAPIEGQLALNLPSPGIVDRGVPALPLQRLVDEQPDLEILHLQVVADPSGDVKEVSVEKSATISGPLKSGNLQALERNLQAIFGQKHIPYDRVQIAVDGQLHYGELMKIVDVCAHQKLADGETIQRISFIEL
ncbi:MAG: Biopolymer transport protein ExbD/TolR [Schlesneria sp.]|nr:Biopolymer transport protein ExbD/TolR [Schlesneria sp.]